MTELFPAGTFTPDPRPSRVARMLSAQYKLDLKLLLRNGEQLLLTMFIPITLLADELPEGGEVAVLSAKFFVACNWLMACWYRSFAWVRSVSGKSRMVASVFNLACTCSRVRVADPVAGLAGDAAWPAWRLNHSRTGSTTTRNQAMFIVATSGNTPLPHQTAPLPTGAIVPLDSTSSPALDQDAVRTVSQQPATGDDCRHR